MALFEVTATNKRAVALVGGSVIALIGVIGTEVGIVHFRGGQSASTVSPSATTATQVATAKPAKAAPAQPAIAAIPFAGSGAGAATLGLRDPFIPLVATTPPASAPSSSSGSGFSSAPSSTTSSSGSSTSSGTAPASGTTGTTPSLLVMQVYTLAGVPQLEALVNGVVYTQLGVGSQVSGFTVVSLDPATGCATLSYGGQQGTACASSTKGSTSSPSTTSTTSTTAAG